MSGKLHLEQSVHCLRAFSIHIIRQEGGIHTRIGGQFLFVELLDNVQRHLSREPEFLVAVHLQRGQVIQAWRRLLTVFLLHLRHREGLSFDGGKGLLALLLRRELTRCGRERCVTIYGGQHPVGLRLEVVYLLLTVHDQRQRGRLHTTDGEHLPVLSIFNGIQARTVYTKEPVAHSPRQSSQVERLIFVLVFQRGETLTDGFVGHRRNPQALHRTLGLRFLHHPSLNQFTLLSGVTAVDDAVGLLHQALDDGKLLLDACIVLQADAELRRNHG